MNKLLLLIGLGICGCADPALQEKPSTFTTTDGDTVTCDSSMGPYEDRYVGAPGYDPDGCTLTERMAHVAAFADEESDIQGENDPSLAAASGELGKLSQPITVAVGAGLAVDNPGSGNGLVPANPGHCVPSPTWTTAQPLLGQCLIPFGANRIHWEVWPGYGISVQYMRDRMKTAFSAWNRSVTCGGKTFVSALQSSDTSEQPLFTNEEDRYNTAAISVYPIQDGPNAQFGARTEVSSAIASPRTPIRNGIRYWSWTYLPIAVNSFVIEGFKQDACVTATDPQRGTKLQRAYEWILAHELGHAFGLPHQNSGIMRASNATTCADVFTTNAIASRLTSGEKYLVTRMFDSSGFSVFNDFNTPQQGCGGTDMVDMLPTDRSDFE